MFANHTLPAMQNKRWLELVCSIPNDPPLYAIIVTPMCKYKARRTNLKPLSIHLMTFDKRSIFLAIYPPRQICTHFPLNSIEDLCGLTLDPADKPRLYLVILVVLQYTALFHCQWCWPIFDLMVYTEMHR